MACRVQVLVAVLCASSALGCDDRGGRQSVGAAPAGGSVGGSTAGARMPTPSPPKAAAMAWGDAVDAGNFAGAQALSIGTPDQIKTLEAICAEKAAENAFDAAVDTKLRDELSDVVLQGLATTIQYADEHVEGDSVRFPVYVENMPIIVRKQPDGEWRVTLEQFTSDVGASARTLGRAYEKLTQEVNAGKYANRMRAMDALETKLTEAAAELGVDLSARPLADDAAATSPTPAAPAAPVAPPAAPATPGAPVEGDGFE